MAVINRNTLVLNSVSAVRGVVTCTVGMGFESANGTTVAVPFSMRPSSQPSFPNASLRTRGAGQKASPRLEHADRYGAVSPADRAGRPDGSGILASGSFASFPAIGGTGSTAARQCGRYTAKRLASVGNVLPQRHLASRVHAPGTLWRLPRAL